MENLKKAMIIRNGNVVGAVGDKNFSTAPIGTVLAYAGNEAPRGYLLADGASYPTTEYPDLYAVIGNTYGGDSTNFNVPNLVDKFIQGSTTSGTEKEAGLPNITGSIYKSNTDNGNQFLTDNSSPISEGALYINEWMTARSIENSSNTFEQPFDISFDASLSNPIYGNSNTVQPPALTMVYIIKAFHTNEGQDEGLSDDVINYVDNKVDGLISDTSSSTTSTWSSSMIVSEIGRTQIPHVGTSTGWKAEKDLSSLPVGTYRLTAMHSSSGGVIDALILKTGYSYFLKTILKEGANITVNISGDTLTIAESTTSIGVISVFLNVVGINA